MPSRHLYKVLTTQQWEQAQHSGSLAAPVDLADGFVHLSTAAQLAGTLQRYFSDAAAVVVLQLQPDLGANLRWETSLTGDRPGEFPHYYGDLTADRVSNTWIAQRNAIALPEEILLQVEQDASANES